ncbi:MAG: hypothetical protein VSS75_005525 [Candidatus Parabeggiatoa sp.]|nr:hypothetical protein [Candidatus Parabeggiatoa sp.]
MAIEIANTTAAITQRALATAGSLNAFLLAHPVGVAVVGGALVGAGTYYLMQKFLKKKEEEPAAA